VHFAISIRSQNIGKDSHKIKINMIILLILPSGFSLTSLIKKSASRERLFGAISTDRIPVASLMFPVSPLYLYRTLGSK
jgi:hypothetical protein